MFAHLRSLTRSILRRKELENDMDVEMRFHIEALENDLIRVGVAPVEARRRARNEFGGFETTKEDCREAKGLSVLDETIRNLRYAWRSLRRAPGFTAAVIGTLALCIGANTAIYSIVDAVLFRPLPYPEPDRLGTVVRQFARGGASTVDQSQSGYAWETLKPARSFELAASSGGFTGVNLGVDKKSAYIQQQRISAGYFRVLQAPLTLGREFSDEEDVAGGPQAVILSYALWRSAFHSDPEIAGRSVLLRGEPHTVVGVAGESFRAMMTADVWTPLRPSTSGEGGGENYTLIARLRPGATWAQAQTESQSLGAGVIEQLRLPRDVSARMSVLPLQAVNSAGLRDRIFMMWAAVAAVLLIGCVNVASLMLARGAARSQEMATRMALGGGAGRLIRQLTTEAIALGLLGGAAGVALGYFAIHAFQANFAQFGVWQQVRLDGRVLWCAVGASLLTGVLFGLAPALQATRVDVRTALSEGKSRGATGGRSHLLRRALVVTEVALGLALVVSAGLLVRTLVGLENLSPGFDGSNVLSASVSLQDARYRTSASVNRLYRQTLERLKLTPGVESAAVGLHVPYQRWLQVRMDLPGGGADSGGMTAMNYVTPDYFRVFRIPIRAGRAIEERDSEKSQPVVIINEAFARVYLHGREPLGQRVKLRFDGADREIVGVAGDIRQRPGFGRYGPLDYVPAVFVPVTQLPDQNFQLAHTWFSPNWVVRGSQSVTTLAQAVQQAVESADPLLPVASFRTMDAERSRALSSRRLNALLLSFLAGLALILSAVGIYGLIANSVVERTRELGIRMALGASVPRAIWTAMKPGMLLSLIGVLAGTGLAIAATGLIKSSLYGVQALDPVTFAAAAACLAVVGTIASLVPALRLLWLNPSQTLRQ